MNDVYKIVKCIFYLLVLLLALLGWHLGLIPLAGLIGIFLGVSQKT